MDGHADTSDASRSHVNHLTWAKAAMAMLLAAALSEFFASAQEEFPGLIRVAATAQGWSSALGFTNDHAGNPFVGRYVGSTNLYHNWFVFDIPAFTARLARAEVILNVGQVSLPIGCRPFQLHEVTNSAAVVMARPSLADVYADLGDGTLYGQTSLCYYHEFSDQTIPLSSEVVRALSAAEGQRFVIGGSLEGLHSGWDEPEYVGQTVLPARLLLRFAAAPVLTAGPVGFDVAFSYSAQLEVSVYSAEPFGIQWRRNGQAVANATNQTLFFPSFLPEHVGDYDVVVSNASGSVTSLVVRATGHPFDFNLSAQELLVPEGEPVWVWGGFAGQRPASLQWRKDAAPIADATTSVLSIPSAKASDSGRYDLVASNVFGASTSAVLVITVYREAPVFTQEPSGNTNGVYAEQLYLSIATCAAPRAALQWYRDGQPVPGATASSYRVASLRREDAGEYFVVASNSVGVATSTVVMVTVQVFPPVVSLHPASVALLPGSNHTLSANALSVVPLSFQWWRDGAPLLGATNPVLPLLSVGAKQTGRYTVTASNDTGTATSEAALVSLAPGGPADFWERVVSEVADGSNHLYAAAVGGGLLMAVGRHGTVLFSTNGVHFQSPAGSLGSESLRAIVFDGRQFLAVSDAGGLFRFHEQDGVVWIRQQFPSTEAMYGIAVGSNATVVVGRNGVAQVSTNGTDFFLAPSATTDTLNSVCWGNGRFVAVGRSTNNNASVIVSTDGVHWTSHSVAGSDQPVRVQFLSEEFFILGWNSDLWASADGMAWILRNSAIRTQRAMLFSLNKSADLHLLAGNTPVGTVRNTLAFTSTDGTNWTPRAAPQGFRMLAGCKFGGRWFLVGEGGAVWRSRPLQELRLEAKRLGTTLHLLLSGEILDGVLVQSTDDLAAWHDLHTVTNGMGHATLDVAIPPGGARNYFRLEQALE